MILACRNHRWKRRGRLQHSRLIVENSQSIRTLRDKESFVTDRYGELCDQWSVEGCEFPGIDQIPSSLDLIEILCEECGAPTDRPISNGIFAAFKILAGNPLPLKPSHDHPSENQAGPDRGGIHTVLSGESQIGSTGHWSQ